MAACGYLTPNPKASNVDSGTRTESDSALYSQWRDGYAKMYHITNPPSVPPVKTVAPEDATGLFNECLRSKGFAAASDGSYNVPVAQENAFQGAEYVCRVSYPPAAKTLQPLTTQQKGIWYDYVVKTEVPCLDGQGFHVTNVPSRDTFISSFDSNTYTPYTEVLQELSPSQRNEAFEVRLNSKCPQQPPTGVLYG